MTAALPTGPPAVPILVIGDLRRREFREAAEAIRHGGDVMTVPSLSEAEDALATGRAQAAVIVLAQAYPGQFPARAVGRLRALAPLARVVGLLGSWCEGEARSGSPWPAAIRVYGHQWVAVWESELGRLRSGAATSWALPVTASEEERILFQASGPLREAPGRRGGVVAAATPSLEMYELLSAICRRRGLSVAWLRPDRPCRLDGAAAVLFDATDLNGAERSALRRIGEQLRPARTVVLMDFPRVEDRARARTAGAVAVISKPFSLEAVDWHLDRVLDG